MIQVHFIFLLIFITSQNSFTQGKRAMTLEDVMKFKQIEDVKIATGGNWVVYTARPDRGDPEVIVLSSDGKKKYTVSMARSPIISHDEMWVASVNEIPALEKANLSNEEASEKNSIHCRHHSSPIPIISIIHPAVSYRAVSDKPHPFQGGKGLPPFISRY